MIIGAQLFSVRDYCKDLTSFSETLAKVADMGYTAVQVSGTCDYEGEWLAEELKKNGLIAPLTHYSFDKIVGDPTATLAHHKAFGCPYIGIGSMPHLFEKDCDVVAAFNAFVEKLRPVIDIYKKTGYPLMYHNHDKEYLSHLGGKNVMELLAEAFTADELCFTLDVHWVMRGGAKIEDEIRRLDGRLPCVHFKDLVTVDGEIRFAPVGEGVIDFASLIPLFEKAGTKYAFVEQDASYGRDPFDCLRTSYKHLTSLGLH